MKAEHLTLCIRKNSLDVSCKFIFINEIEIAWIIKIYKRENKTPPRTTPQAMPKAWQLNLVPMNVSYTYIGPHMWPLGGTIPDPSCPPRHPTLPKCTNYPLLAVSALVSRNEEQGSRV